MKNFIIILSLAMVSCGTQTNYKSDKNAPTVDYNQPYEYHNTRIKIKDAIKKHDEQTVYLYNGAEITYKKFQKLLREGKIKSVENISDKNKILELGYSEQQVKRILSTNS